MALQWINGQITRKHVWSEGLFTLSIHCPGVFAFESGQFLQLGLQLPDRHLHRPYSVASPHGDLLEFFIVRVDTGALTPLLWNLSLGDSIHVSNKATGSFTLSHCPDADELWLFATGTGLAPYIAMLREPYIWERYGTVILVHGVRYLSDLAYVDELTQLAQDRDGSFYFVPVISREDVPGAISGRITTAISNGELEQRVERTLEPGRGAVMMCGNPLMLDDVEILLQQRGMKKHKHSDAGHYVVERYW